MAHQTPIPGVDVKARISAARNILLGFNDDATTADVLYLAYDPHQDVVIATVRIVFNDSKTKIKKTAVYEVSEKGLFRELR